MSYSDYIPSKDSELVKYCFNMSNVLEELKEKLNIPSERVSAFGVQSEKFNTAYTKATARETRTYYDIAVKNAEKKATVACIRKLVNEHLAYNPELTIADSEALGIRKRPYSKPRKRAPIPTSAPLTIIDTSVRFQHTIRIKNAETGRIGKPNGVKSCEIWCKVGGTPPKDKSELTFVGNSSTSKFLIRYSGAEVEKTIYYWSRWINTRNEVGPWSVEIEATVGK